MCICHDTRFPEHCFYEIAQEAHSLQSFAVLWWETSLFKWKMNSVTLLSFSFILKASQQTSGEGELF